MTSTFTTDSGATQGLFLPVWPRGTGKSTWIRMRFADAYRIDLLNESLFQSYLADIGRFAVELGGIESGQTVVVDEVQRLPSLLNEVHRNIEERSMRFILCGSSARKLKTSGTNMLAGRAAQRVMHPFLPEELGSKFDLEQALRWGTLPVVWAAAIAETLWKHTPNSTCARRSRRKPLCTIFRASRASCRLQPCFMDRS